MLNHKPKGAGPKSQVSILGTLCAVCADKGERQASSEILPTWSLETGPLADPGVR